MLSSSVSCWGIPGIATGPFEAQGKLDVSPQGLELLQVELQTALGHLTVSGTLGTASNYSGSKLHLHLEGNNAHTLMSVFNIDALPNEPFSLDTLIETTETGLILERGVLVTIKDERLELDGFLSFDSGSKGTDLEVKVNGQHLAQVLQRVLGDSPVPDMPYELTGHVRVRDEGIELENVKAALADIELSVAGSLIPRGQLLGTAFEFQVSGNEALLFGKYSALG